MRPYESVQSGSSKVSISIVFKFTIVGSFIGSCLLLRGSIGVMQ